MAGGYGGSSNGGAAIGGAGGTGYNGASGKPGGAGGGNTSSGGTGGGGGAAGGGAGGAGGRNGSAAGYAGGNGGTAAHRDGYDGTGSYSIFSSGAGGGGGGGGYNGFTGITLTNGSGTMVRGGNGGKGGAIYLAGGGGGGGAGGYGAVVTGAAASTNAGGLYGGSGGAGGNAGQGGGVGGPGASGGDGGTGALFSSAGAMLTNTGTIAAGIGGAGGSGTTIGSDLGGGGRGGAGGAGVAFAGTGFILDNQSGISGANGGAGGAAGTSRFASGNGGVGGVGGDGVLASGGLIDNGGTIAGGAGATGGQGATITNAGNGGAGGDGIEGADLTIVNSGTISAGAGGAKGSGNGSQAGAAGNAVHLTGGASSLTLGGTINGNINVDGVTTSLTLVNSGNQAFYNVLIGTGSVTFAGDPASTGVNSLFVYTANTYSGSTTIEGSDTQTEQVALVGSILNSKTISIGSKGQLYVENGSGIATTAAVSTSADGVFILDQSTQIGSLNGTSGFVDFNNGSVLTTGTNNTDDSYGGRIGADGRPDGGLTKIGTGTLTLTGANIYNGATTISAGTLKLGDGGATGSLDATSGIENDAALVFDRSDAGLAISAVISGGGTVSQIGSGTTTLSGANTYTGGTTIQAGTLDLEDSSAAGTGDIVFAGNRASFATLEIGDAADPADGGTFGNAIDHFRFGNRLDLTGLAFQAGATAVLQNGVLTVTSGGISENFDLGGPTSNTGYYAYDDGAGGTMVSTGATGLIRSTRGTVYDPNRSVGTVLQIYAGNNLSYTATTISSADGTVLTISNGTQTQEIDYAARTALDLDFSTNVAAVTLTGGAYGDVLSGGRGDDMIDGGAGDDLLSGGSGTNTIDGGTGSDTVSYAAYAHGVAVALFNGTGRGNGVSDTLLNIENIVGSAHNDTLVGDAGMNVLEGGAGADSIKSGGGGGDFASYVHAASGVEVDMLDMSQNTGEAAGDRFTGIRNVYGSAGDDTLIGDDHANILVGVRGTDTIDGEGGNDRIRIRATPTSVAGGNGRDTLVIVDGMGPVALTDSNFTGFEKVQVADRGNVDLSGYSGGMYIVSSSVSGGRADIVGSSGADQIHAGDGADFITGGFGDDALFAGSGPDTFDFTQPGFGHDVIYGASLSKDTFDVDGLGAELHFASVGGGADTLVYGADRTTDAFVLKGIQASDAEAAAAGSNSPFHYSNPT